MSALQTRATLAALVAMALLSLPATSVEAQQQKNPQGQPQRAQGEQAPQAVSEQDVAFARKAAQGGMLQVVLSKVATQQAESQPVQQFAQQTVDSLSQAGKQLHSLAQQLGLDLPRQPGEQAQQLQDALADLEGDLLEREYLWNMVAASTVAVNVFEEEAEDGMNQKLVSFADQMLPKLQQHRKQAVEIWGKLGE